MASTQQRAFAASVPLLLLAALASSCKQPIQPAVGSLGSLDTSNDIRAVQREEERLGREVLQLARSQVGEELAAAHGLVRSPELDAGASAVGRGRLSRVPDSQVVGKLERATPDQIVIRDDSGFEYWLRASDSTQVTVNGQPARLTDFKQGTDVRAEFFWEGRQRIATAVDVLAASEGRDGGLLDLPSGS